MLTVTMKSKRHTRKPQPFSKRGMGITSSLTFIATDRKKPIENKDET